MQPFQPLPEPHTRTRNVPFHPFTARDGPAQARRRSRLGATPFRCQSAQRVTPPVKPAPEGTPPCAGAAGWALGRLGSLITHKESRRYTGCYAAFYAVRRTAQLLSMVGPPPHGSVSLSPSSESWLGWVLGPHTGCLARVRASPPPPHPLEPAPEGPIPAASVCRCSHSSGLGSLGRDRLECDITVKRGMC